MATTDGPAVELPLAGELPSRLFRAPFIVLCAIAFLGFASMSMTQPLVPLLVLERGGDAAFVGMVLAVFSLPALFLRPIMGVLIDLWSRRRVYLFGALGVAVVSMGYLLPGLTAILLARLVHGAVWSAFMTGGAATLAEVAPPDRRGEASGIYNLAPGLASLAIPALALLLHEAGHTELAIVASSVFILVAAALIGWGPLPPDRPVTTSRRPTMNDLIDRATLLPMSLDALTSAVSTLFWLFPPVFATLNDIPVSELAWYYPILALSLIVARFTIGRLLDRIPRRTAIITGGLVAIAGLGIATFAGSIAALTVAGCVWTVGSSFISPTAMAMAMDRADPSRRGAAMATYSLGYQLGMGFGSMAWGLVIAAAGFPVPFVAAGGVIVVLLLVATTIRDDGGHRQPL